jgi:hypothetical protein
MRQRLFGIALLASSSLAGCSFSHGTIGDTGSDASVPKDAPLDTQPIDAKLDAMGDGPPPVPTDTDSDGVVDTADNCPTVANANQRNHDGDAKGDACDGCPHLASATDPDGDLDGVGDACDPRPSTSGDARVLFEGFYDASSIAGWTASGNGTWSVGSGVLTQSSATTSGITNALAVPTNVTRAAVTAGARVIALGNGNNFEAPHVSVASGVGQNQSYWCSVVDEGNNDKIYATIVRPGMAPDYPSNAWPGTMAANSDLRMTSALIGSFNTCTVVQGIATANVSGSTGSTTGMVQVATRTASASFDYLFVVSIGN